MNHLKACGCKLFYKFFHPCVLHKGSHHPSSKNAEVKDQRAIENITHALGFAIDDNGLCCGLMNMWASAVVTGDELEYFKRIQFIEDLYLMLDGDATDHESGYTKKFTGSLANELLAVKDKIKNGTQMDDLPWDERTLLEVESFLENVYIIEYTNRCSFLFENGKGNFWERCASSKLEQRGNMATLYNYCYADPANDPDKHFNDYFNSLGAMLGKVKNPQRIPITIQTIDHMVGLRYVSHDKWLFVDPNDFPGKTIHTNVLSEALRKSLLTSRCNNDGLFSFNMTILASNLARFNDLGGLASDLESFRNEFSVTADKLGPDINYFPLLLHAVSYGHADIITELTRLGLDLNYKDPAGSSVLNAAAAKNQTAIIQLLLQLGAIPDKLDANDLTPLSWAAINNNDEMLAMLLEAGADVNQLNEAGKSALHLAAGRGHASIVETLIDKGANVNQQSADGATPLHLAAINNDAAAIKVLLAHGAQLEAVNEHACTPLIAAALYDSYEALELLLEAGADCNYACEAGTALQVATEKGNTRVVELLSPRVTAPTP